MREAEVRKLLTDRLAQEHAAEPDTLILSELGLCQSTARIDLAVINGAMTGWEIKTERDTLKRLPAQALVYSRVFDRMWLATAERHLNGALALIPDWWGVVVIPSEPNGRFATARKARLNRHIDLNSLVRLLWRDETYQELQRLGIAAGLERAPRAELWSALANAVPKTISKTALRHRVRNRLRDREDWRSGPQHR